MRHGRKSSAVKFNGYKRHVLTDLDSGLVRAVGLTPANVLDWQPGTLARRFELKLTSERHLIPNPG